LLEKAGGALTYSSGHPEQLAEIVRALYNKKIDGDELGKRYHNYVTSHHTREKWAQRYLNLLESIKKT
ncbi:MAG: hypothetical protein NT002_14250, partial [candidate division Zixibacteria bacterium]|nr:hypothetical protein [candidate division Zixibacteria bacterium]